MKNKNLGDAKEFVLNNLMYVIAGSIAMIYALTSFLTVSISQRPIWHIFQDGFMFFLLSIAFGNLFNLHGIRKGNQTEEIHAAEKRKQDMNLKVAPIIQHMEKFCTDKNATRLVIKRSKILASVGLAYTDCFDEDASAKNLSFEYELSWKKRLLGRHTPAQRKEWEKYRAFKNAREVKVKEISVSLIMSDEIPSADSDNNIYKTKTGYTKLYNTKSTSSKILLAIIFGLFVIDSAVNFSFGILIWRLFQVIVLTTLGYLQMQRSYAFVKEEISSKINGQCDYMQEFYNLYSDRALLDFDSAKAIMQQHGYVTDGDGDPNQENPDPS